MSYEAVVNLIGSTRTRSGLRVKAVLDTNLYATGLKVTDRAMKDLRITPHSFHGEWNYTVRPRTKRKQGQ